ncbi:hypothetical protein GCM10010350_51210 [Streptomyces galilaeus]|nr:hypothetical protein GCM10010350_51210 [Streptomyces galilaeus]
MGAPGARARRSSRARVCAANAPGYPREEFERDARTRVCGERLYPPPDPLRLRAPACVRVRDEPPAAAGGLRAEYAGIMASMACTGINFGAGVALRPVRREAGRHGHAARTAQAARPAG